MSCNELVHYLKLVESEIKMRNLTVDGYIEHLFIISDDYEMIRKAIKKLNIPFIKKEEAQKTSYFSDNFSLMKTTDIDDVFCLDIIMDDRGFKSVAVFCPVFSASSLETWQLGNSLGIYSVLFWMHDKKTISYCWTRDNFLFFNGMSTLISTKECSSHYIYQVEPSDWLTDKRPYVAKM